MPLSDLSLIDSDPSLRERAIRRFNDLVDRSGGADACWPCAGHPMSRGYVGVYVPGAGKGKKVRPLRNSAHRLSYALHVGPIPTGLMVCHRCDNPRCCNPRHLFLGTAKDNTADMYRKGRGKTHVARGDAHPRTKLTTEGVLDLVKRVRAGEPRANIAREYGLTKGGLDCIMIGASWAHVTGISKTDPAQVAERHRLASEAVARSARERFTGKRQSPEQVRKRVAAMLETKRKNKS